MLSWGLNLLDGRRLRATRGDTLAHHAFAMASSFDADRARGILYRATTVPVLLSRAWFACSDTTKRFGTRPSGRETVFDALKLPLGAHESHCLTSPSMLRQNSLQSAIAGRRFLDRLSVRYAGAHRLFYALNKF